MSDAQHAIAMSRISKRARQLLRDERRAHRQTRKQYGDALRVAQYLSSKAEKLKNIVDGMAEGKFMSISMLVSNPELENMEKAVLKRAAEWNANDGGALHDVSELTNPPTRRKKLRKDEVSPPAQGRCKEKQSRQGDPSSEIDTLPLPDVSSDGLSIDPALLLSSIAALTSDTLPTNIDVPSGEQFVQLLRQDFAEAAQVLGVHFDAPVAQRALTYAPNLSREELRQMKAVLDVDEESRHSGLRLADLMYGP